MKTVRNEVKYYKFLNYEKYRNISSQRILIETFPTNPPPKFWDIKKLFS